jgi:hypothetical protein
MDLRNRVVAAIEAVMSTRRQRSLKRHTPFLN